MSIQAVSWAFEQTVPDPAAKLVLLSLANAQNGKSGKCFPTIEQIADETSCSRSTVKRKLQWLSEMGWIEIHETRDETGRQLANSYTIRFGLEPGEGFRMNPRGSTSEPGEGFSCEPPLKEPEEIPEEDILSETSSDASKPTKKRNSYPEPFEAIWKAYPTDPNMSKKEAFDAWKRLDADDKAAASASVPAFVAYCKAHPDYRPIHLCRYIAKRRFDGHGAGGSAPSNGKQFATVADVFIDKDNKLSPDELRREWIKRLEFCRRNRTWNTDMMGAPPGKDGCRVPVELLTDHDRNFDWYIEFYRGAA